MSSELSTRDQEITALQARMQASNQEHVKETQQHNSKVRCHQPLTVSFSLCWVCCQVIECYGCVWPQIRSLQEQLENGPNAQLARLQQENSILRDALNQATSQAESRY